MTPNDRLNTCQRLKPQQPLDVPTIEAWPGSIIEGHPLACCVKGAGRNYLVFEERIDWQRTGRCFAVQTDFCTQNTRFITQCSMLFATIRLQTIKDRFWGWDVHHPNLGEGWHRYPEQNIETESAPANYWEAEIREKIVPQIQYRLRWLPLMAKRWKVSPPYVSPLNLDDKEVSLEELADLNIPKDKWVPEGYRRCRERILRDLHHSEPVLRRRLLQAAWLINQLSSLGATPVKMMRTTINSQRRFSLPVPLFPFGAPGQKACCTPQSVKFTESF